MSKTCAIIGVGKGLGMAIARWKHRENYQLAIHPTTCYARLGN